MLKFKQDGPKEWTINNENHESIKLSLLSSTVTNKYYIVTKFIEEVSKNLGDEFDNWFMNFIQECQNEETRAKVVVDNILQIKEYANNYLQIKHTDFSRFVDESKAKKNSILFHADEIEKIIKLSSYLKIYSVICNNEELRLGQTAHREIYNKFASEIVETDIVRKIYDVIKTKTFRYNLTDKFMWEYIKNVQGKDIGVHVIEIFNFIMNHILILCEEDKNPITYFVGVIDESVKWFLRSVYKGSIVYDDSISTEDIQGINTDNLKTYSYNDTLGRLKGIAYEKVYEVLQRQQTMSTEDGASSASDENIISFHERASAIEYVSPLCETLVYPVLSYMTNIPYSHFRTLSPEHACIISVYMQNLFRKVFKVDYKDLFSLLNYFPSKSPSVGTTYKIKSIHEFIEAQEKQSFYGFNTKILPHTILCHFIGRISRIDFCDVITGKKLGGIPLSKIEQGVIQFFTLYFAGKLQPEMDEMAKLMNADF